MAYHWSLNDSKSPRHFNVFWLISTMMWFGWSPSILLFPCLLVPIQILWGLFQVRQLKLVQQLHSWIYSVQEGLFFLTMRSAEMVKSTRWQILSFFKLLIVTSIWFSYRDYVNGFYPKIQDNFISIDSIGRILFCVYDIWTNFLLHDFQCISIPTLFCLVLFVFFFY